MDNQKKILLVEDDTFTREIYEEILKGSNFLVTVAIDGEEAFTKIQQGGFDLILLDVMMPKMTGLQVLEALKNTQIKQQNGPIILLTNFGHDPIIKDALSKGVKDYLIKSDLNPDQLVAQVQKFLQ